MQGLMGDCGAPGSAVCWKVRGCVGVCDGVVTVPAVAWSRGGDVEHREPKTGRILLQVSFLYPSSSHCFTPSPSQMNKTDLALSPHPTPKIHLQNVCFHASWNNIVTCLGLFFLPSSLWPALSHKSNFYRGVKQIWNRALFGTLFCM